MADSKVQRLLGTLLLLRSREWVSSKVLSQRFQVSLRTIYRDIETLQKYGIPVRGVPGPDGGYKLQTESPVDPLIMSDEDAQHLFLLGMSSSSEKGRLDRNVFDTIENLVRPEDQGLLRQISSRIHFDTREWYWKDESSTWMPMLRESVFSSRSIVLNFTERRSSDVIEEELNPFGLVWKGGQWYLIAQGPNGDIKRIRASRITHAIQIEKHFTYPDGFDLRKWWHEDLESFGKGNIEVRLQIDLGSIDELARLANKDDSQIEYYADHATLRLFVDDWRWLIPVLLSYTGAVFVESPIELKSEVLRVMADGLRDYGQGPKWRRSPSNNDDSRMRATRGTGSV